jgi:signal transduction histidine kinase
MRIVVPALDFRKVSDLPQILRLIAEETQSFAALWWELASSVDTARPGPLFVLAGWLENGDRFAAHSMTLQSRTGITVGTGKTLNCFDVTDDPRLHDETPEFLHRYAIRCFASIPLRYADSTQGALNLYRTSREPYSKADCGVAEQFARTLPHMYEGLLEKNRFDLVSAVNGVVQDSENHPTRLDLAASRTALDGIARTIAESFRALEVSIYLVPPSNDRSSARLAATTCPEYIRKTQYRAGEPGLTGWILKEAKPIHIFDLTSFDRDRAFIEQGHPGLTWRDGVRIAETTRKLLGVAEHGNLQPLSFIGVPIIVGGELFGALRCCTPLSAPYFYTKRDVKLISIVASQVGHYWSNWLQLGSIHNQNESWQALMTAMRDLMHEAASKTEFEVEGVLQGVLSVARKVIHEAEIVDVRLHDPEKRDLYFASVQGEAWKSGDVELDNRRRGRRFPLKEKSIGAWVFNNNRTRTIPNVAKDSDFNPTFSGVRSMIVAPISSGNEKYGVLDIRITKESGIPPNAPAITELLGRQLGLSLNLFRTLRELSLAKRHLHENLTKLQQADAERERFLRSQTQVFEDLEHQLKGPVVQAHIRVSNLLDSRVSEDRIEHNMLAIRGLLSKAKRVLRIMAVFVDLADQKPVKPKPRIISRAEIVKLLIESCVDNILLEGKRRGIKAQVEEASFVGLEKLIFDMDLLEQVVNNIIDNACKYSFNFQTIRVSGGLNSDGKFFISVVNKGLSLTPEDLPHVTKRGWRGQSALLSTGQGSGIGCWFVQQVMESQGGELQLFSTSPERLTEVRLQF